MTCDIATLLDSLDMPATAVAMLLLVWLHHRHELQMAQVKKDDVRLPNE